MTSKQLDHTNEQELIRKYLDDSLSRDEELQLAELYDSNKEFREALDGLEMLTADQFTNTMTSINSRIESKIKSSANLINISGQTAERDNVRQLFAAGTSMRRLAIAASLVLCLLFGGTILMNQVKSPGERIMAANFEAKPYPDLITRGSGDDLSQPEKLAISAYNAENYEVSVKYFADLHTQYPDNEKYGLFLGISHMGMNDHSSAIDVLESLQPNAEKYDEDINWYLALSYLRMKDVEAAKVLLTSLAGDSDSYYQESSDKILKKLK